MSIYVPQYTESQQKKCQTACAERMAASETSVNATGKAVAVAAASTGKSICGGWRFSETRA